MLVVVIVVPAGYPVITDTPQLKAIEKDRNTLLSCGAMGTPEPSITWLKDMIPIDFSDPRLKLLPTGKIVFTCWLSILKHF